MEDLHRIRCAEERRREKFERRGKLFSKAFCCSHLVLVRR